MLMMKQKSHIDILSVVFAVVVVLGIINYFSEVNSLWYVWNTLVVVMPVLFIATHLNMKDHASKYLIVVLLALPAIATVGMGLAGHWGEIGSETVQNYWDVIVFYVFSFYSFLIGSKMRIE